MFYLKKDSKKVIYIYIHPLETGDCVVTMSASEFLLNLEEMFIRYYTCRIIYSNFQLHTCVLSVAQ